MNNSDLIDLLKDLSSCIVGKWIVYGGAMLGLHRDGKFLEWEKDIDIVLIDDAYIDYDKLKTHESIGVQEYYMHTKIYRKGFPKYKVKNKWNEYVSYIRMLPENVGKNRAQLLKIASQTYSEEYKDSEFTICFIDVETMKLDKDNQYKTKYFPKCYFEKKEIDNIQYIQYGNMSIPTATYLDSVCARHYGEDWTIPNSNWKY